MNWKNNTPHRKYRAVRFNTVFPKLIVLLLLCTGTSLRAQQSKSFISNGKKVQVAVFEQEMKKMMKEIGIPALSLAIIENNQVVYARTLGYKELKSKNPAGPETVFEACSLSKTFLVFVVQELVNKGLLNLNKPLSEYLEYAPLKHDPRYRLITAHMVLSHSSGIENWAWNNNKDTLEIVSDPGTRFVYSGEGFQYLAKVVEQLLGEPYDSYIQKRILQPLQLNTTFLKYSTENTGRNKTSLPGDYAVGYTEFGVPVEKWKNIQSVPASGIHTTAGDYAKLVTALFDGKYISRNEISSMLHPAVQMEEGHKDLSTNDGFFGIYSPADTIVFFNGVNMGFKSEVFYSVPQKRGFAFFTNCDRGELALNYISQLTAGLNLEPLLATSFHTAYPSPAISLFRTYCDKGEKALLTEINTYKQKNRLQPNTLNELGDVLISSRPVTAKKVLEKSVALYPESSLAACLLGGACYQLKEYELSYRYLKKAKELQFDMWDISGPFNEVSGYVAEMERRKSLLSDIQPGQNNAVQAEDYNSITGATVDAANDTDGDKAVVFGTAGAQATYKVNISKAGNYTLSVRVLSEKPGSVLQLRSGNNKRFNIPSANTNKHKGWTTVSATIKLEKGEQLLQWYAPKDGTRVNWFALSGK